MQTPSEVVARLFNWDISEETGRQGDKLAWDTFRVRNSSISQPGSLLTRPTQDIAKEEYKKGALDTSYPWRKQDARKQQNVRNKTLDRLKTELNIEHQLSLMTDEIKVFALNWRLSKSTCLVFCYACFLLTDLCASSKKTTCAATR